MIGDRIKELRTDRDMTQAELGKLIGVGKSTINKYELNKIAIPSAKIEALATVLRVSPAYLMGWEENPVIVQAAKQAAFRKEIGDLTDAEMYLVRTYRKATDTERSFLYTAATLVTRVTPVQPRPEASPDGQIAADSLTRQYLQAQSQRETVEK